MRIANWLRKRLNRPLRFDLDAALEEAQLAAHRELARLEDPSTVVEIERWEKAFDPVTHGVECDQHPLRRYYGVHLWDLR